jgi:hypothetical protein
MNEQLNKLDGNKPVKLFKPKFKDFKELGQYGKSFIVGSLPYILLLDRFKTLSLEILLHIEGEIDPLN